MTETQANANPGGIRRWLCKLGFHDKEVTKTLGILTFARCRRCGKEGQIDSQGNLF